MSLNIEKLREVANQLEKNVRITDPLDGLFTTDEAWEDLKLMGQRRETAAKHPPAMPGKEPHNGDTEI